MASRLFLPIPTESPKKRRNSTGPKAVVKTGKRGRPAKNPKPKIVKKSEAVISNDDSDSDSDIEAPPPISQRSKSILIEKARKKDSTDQSDSPTSSDESQRAVPFFTGNSLFCTIVCINI